MSNLEPLRKELDPFCVTATSTHSSSGLVRGEAKGTKESDMESVMKNEKRTDVWTPYETGVISGQGSTCVINRGSGRGEEDNNRVQKEAMQEEECFVDSNNVGNCNQRGNETRVM